MLIPRFSRMFPGILLAACSLLLSSDPACGHVILDDPNGGESLEVGSVFTIEWHIQIAHDLQNWDLWYSTTGPGGHWISIYQDLPHGSPDVGRGLTHD